MVVIYVSIIKIELLTTTPQGLNRKCLGYIFLSSHFFLSTNQTLSIRLTLPLDSNFSKYGYFTFNRVSFSFICTLRTTCIIN